MALTCIFVYNSIDFCGHLIFYSPFQVSNFLVKNSQEAGEHIDADSEEHKKMMKNIFEHEDKDKDGFISMEEFSGPKHDEL